MLAVLVPPSTSSGAMYIGVPTMAPLSVIEPVPVSRARPKSVIATRGPPEPDSAPLRSIRLPGLMSRCTTPWSCANCSARPTAAAMAQAFCSGSGPTRSRSSSVTPSTNSIANQCRRPFVPWSTKATMSGWRTRAMMRPSRRKRASARSVSVRLGGSTLSAMRSPVARSRAS
ncbi:MAG TPA: hypothetical protein VFZ65_13420 [Planctomycetota bacterium]|nr:hypothetical protein [Planctomycetota bacterium]